MGHYNFRKDLKESEKSVELVMDFLKSVGCTDITSNDDGRFDIEYTGTKGDTRTAEVKNDLMYEATGNIAIEFESRGKPSGISTSKADVWYYVLGTEIYICSTGILRSFLIEHWDRFSRVKGGDDKTSKLCLLPMNVFKDIFKLV